MPKLPQRRRAIAAVSRWTISADPFAGACQSTRTSSSASRVSVPTITGNPAGCNIGGPAPFCEGGLLIIDPANLPAPTIIKGVATSVIGAFDPTTNTGVLPFHECGPNGSTLGPHDNLLLGCSPANVPDNTATQVINAKTKNFANIGNITGSDEVWFNVGDTRYYTGSSADNTSGKTLAVLGVIDARDQPVDRENPAIIELAFGGGRLQAQHDLCPASGAGQRGGSGGDTTGTPPGTPPTTGSQICGGTNGCVAVYVDTVNKNVIILMRLP